MNEWHAIGYIALAEALLHYIPWRDFLGGNDLPRPVAYALGVCGFAVPLSMWLYEQGLVEIVAALWRAIFTAGIAVLACYGADAVKALWWSDRRKNDHIKVMEDAKKR